MDGGRLSNNSLATKGIHRTMLANVVIKPVNKFPLDASEAPEISFYSGIQSYKKHGAESIVWLWEQINSPGNNRYLVYEYMSLGDLHTCTTQRRIPYLSE